MRLNGGAMCGERVLTMSKPKQVTTNTFGYMTPPSTPGLDALSNFKFQIDPSFGQTASDLKRRRSENRNHLTGAYVTPEMQREALMADDNDIAQQESDLRRQQHYDVNQQDFGRWLSIANLQRPDLVQKEQTQAQKGVDWAGLVNAGLGVASLF